MTEADLKLAIAEIGHETNRRMEANRTDYFETRRKLKLVKDEQLYALEAAREKYMRHYTEQRKAINEQYEQVVSKTVGDYKQMQEELDAERCRRIAELKKGGEA